MKKIKEFGSAADVVTVGVVHDLNLAARFADQIVIMNDGKLFASGAPGKVLTAENIDRVFGVQPTFLEASDGGNYIVFD